MEEHLMTEMKALCQLVEEANRLKLLILKTRLELTGSEKEGDDNHEKLETPKQPEAEIHWSVGGHLESVVEEDVETEGATTPGSMLHPSPFYSAPKRKKSLTPTTPKMDSFSFRYVCIIYCT